MADGDLNTIDREEATEFATSRDEALFARDTDGQLIRVVAATSKDLDTEIKLVIDDEPVRIKKALPLRDSQGTVLRNELGEVIPRATTIYDAILSHYDKKEKDLNPVPILCHREHLTPVGVCRVCLVQVKEVTKSGRDRIAYVPSCTYHVKNDMIVTTINKPAKDEAEQASIGKLLNIVGGVVDLLASEHLASDELESVQLNPDRFEPNELKKIVARFHRLRSAKPPQILPSERHGQRGRDLSSEMIQVNHDACILCQRCVRACVDIKDNDVISRTGKGYATKISFDLDLPMLESSCVSCGECVISCPTDALSFRDEVVKEQVDKLKAEIQEKHHGSVESIPIDELLRDPLFAGIPYKFLEFNGGACVRRRLKKGEYLCRQGDYGTTAFLIQSGKFEILFDRPKGTIRQAVPKQQSIGKRSLWDRFFTRKVQPATVETEPVSVSLLATGTDLQGQVVQERNVNESQRLYRDKKDVILGEMACLNRHPRGATIQAVEDSEVIEIGSNVLYMLQRNASSRKVLNDAYRKYALNSQLEKLAIFDRLSESGKASAAKMLAESVQLKSVEPGQPIFREGEEGSDFFLVRLGYVKISRSLGSREHVINYISPGSAFGEIAALSRIYQNEPGFELSQFNRQPGIRTASASALDHVELVQISSSQLKTLSDNNPEFKRQLFERARLLLERDATYQTEFDESHANFIHQGLYNAQSLLVLDLESCTRCDECTRACADSHGGESRLIREGLRFENFLVATSCRSCTDPYCLVGCPVNAIYREGSKEITIADTCIGCGLCASNCPYGNITMYGHADGVHLINDERMGTRELPVVQQKATTCDQCKSLDSVPRCVYACPHHAAHRMTGEELKKLVASRKLL